MTTTSLGPLLKSARQRHHLTLRSVAATMGCDFTYLCKIEHDDTIPAERLIVGLARLYDLDPDVLMVAAGKAPADLAALLARDVDAIRALRRWSADRMRGGATMTTTSRERREHVAKAIAWGRGVVGFPPTSLDFSLADAALAAALPDQEAYRAALRTFKDAMYRFWCVGANEEELDAAEYALITLVFGGDDAQAGEE